MIKVFTDLQEPFGVLQKIKSFSREEIHLYLIYKLDLVDDVIDFFNKAIILSDRYNVTLLIHEDEINEEPVRQICIKYKDSIEIEEINDKLYERLSKQEGCCTS